MHIVSSIVHPCFENNLLGGFTNLTFMNDVISRTDITSNNLMTMYHLSRKKIPKQNKNMCNVMTI